MRRIATAPTRHDRRAGPGVVIVTEVEAVGLGSGDAIAALTEDNDDPEISVIETAQA
jgi:hypothetical protein